MPPRTRPQLPQAGKDGLPTSVADWIQEAVSTLDQLRWRVSEADYQMRNPNAIIDTLQRKYEKDVAPVLGERQKKRPRYPVYWKLASVPPGLVQKILHFLPLDKVHEAKQVSKLYRSAAHSAMTRGRWKPVRLVAEHFKRHEMPPSLALCRAAWDLDPSEILRLALTWPHPAAAQFLALVEPSLDGLERILRACEPAHDYSFRNHYQHDSDYPFRNHYQRAREPGVTFHIITEWSRRICTHIILYPSSKRRALVLRCLSRALRTWTDAAVAADFFLWYWSSSPEINGNAELVELTRVELTRDWEAGKALAFAAAHAAAKASWAAAKARDALVFRAHAELDRSGFCKRCEFPIGSHTPEESLYCGLITESALATLSRKCQYHRFKDGGTVLSPFGPVCFCPFYKLPTDSKYCSEHSRDSEDDLGLYSSPF